MYRAQTPQGVYHSQQPNYVLSNGESKSIPPTLNQAYFPLNYTGIPMHAGSLEKRQKLKGGCACESNKKSSRRAMLQAGGIRMPGYKGGGLFSKFMDVNNKFANAVTGAITPAARAIAPHLGTVGSIAGAATGIPGLGMLGGLGGNLASQGLQEQVGNGIRAPGSGIKRGRKGQMKAGGIWDIVGAIGGLGRHTQAVVPYLGSIGTVAGAATGLPGLGMIGNLAADASMNGLGIKRRKNTKKGKGKFKAKTKISDSDFTYQTFKKGKRKLKGGNIFDDIGSIFG